MDTYMTFSLYGEKAGETLKDAEAKIRKLESEWSVTNQNSEIYQVNHSNGNPVTLSEDTAEVVRYALDMAKETGGALDPTIYPVLTAWGFTTGKNRVPKETEIRTLLEHVGYEKVILDGQTLTLPEEMELDLGAVFCGKISFIIARGHYGTVRHFQKSDLPFSVGTTDGKPPVFSVRPGSDCLDVAPDIQ